jgi:hypothetical protein
VKFTCNVMDSSRVSSRHSLKGNNARSPGFVCTRGPEPRIQGERNKKMAEHRRIWPVLVYGGLGPVFS